MKQISLTQAFWDYDFTEQELLRKLKHGTQEEKTWIIGRILENLPYYSIWKYITLAQLRTYFPKLHLRPQLKNIWAYTLTLWEQHEKATH